MTDAPRPASKPPFRRVLVANRGEIALRIIRACHELGIEAVAVFSDADAAAAHVRAADLAIRIGPAPAPESYLRGDAIVEVGRATDCDAVHPGYGFLSEREDFARAVEAAGMVFVGPAPDTLARLGDKVAARRVAAAADVPVVPGTGIVVASTGQVPDEAALLSSAERVGYPLMIKAVAGGGGRGMRRIDEPAALDQGVAAASREATAAFGDGAVYLERFVASGRHIEVQLLGDALGEIVAIGERDCSIQRRHQKLVEEAPAPGLTAAERADLHAMAVRIGRAAELRNLATAEFLYEGDGRFWFLEVNTRLQVEHGVTELVTGIDLVHEQLRLAAGEPLSAAVRLAAERASAPRAHAIEVRISAEDPARDFAPTTGRIGPWRVPDGPGVRVDTATVDGDVAVTAYDPLLAKLLVAAEDRPTAIARLRRAIDEFEVGGIQTTLPFVRAVAAHRAFASGDVATDWVERWWDGPSDRLRAVQSAQLAAALDLLETLRPGHRGARLPQARPVTGTGDPASIQGSRWNEAGRWIAGPPMRRGGPR